VLAAIWAINAEPLDRSAAVADERRRPGWSRAGRAGDGASPQAQRQQPLLHCPMRYQLNPPPLTKCPSYTLSPRSNG